VCYACFFLGFKRATNGDVATEPAHGLRQFESYVASADHDEVLRYLFQFERLDVRQRLGSCKAWNRV
jgi:hypothetical protein